MLAADVDDDGMVSFTNACDVSSFQTFQNFISNCVRRQAPMLVKTITIQRWSISHCLDVNRKLKRTLGTMGHEFVLDIDAALSAPHKPNVKLPFGISARSKPSTSKSISAGKSKSGPAGQSKDKVSKARTQQEKWNARAHADPALTSDSEGSAGSLPEEDIHAIAESETANAAEAKELQEEEAVQSQLRDDLHVAACKGGSFFASELGFSHFDVAVSSRAKCYHCKGKIQADSVRVAWYHAQKRPHAWIHADCMPQLVSLCGLQERTKFKLTAELSRQELKSPLREKATHLLQLITVS